jgi:AraC-like DNA-binding protein
VTESRYREFAPHPALARDVACTWIGEIGDDGGYTDRVLPDACIDLVWDGDQLFVAGPDTGPVIIGRGAGTRFVGLRFRPGHAPAFLGVGAHELVDQSVDLAGLWPRDAVDALTEQLDRDPAVSVLEGAVAGYERTIDPLADVTTALAAAARGPRVVEELAAATELSARTLHRRALVAFGYGPKMLQRVLRFRRFLARAEATPSVDLAIAAAAAGYADQAHLTRECVELAGLPPAALLRTRMRSRSV